MSYRQTFLLELREAARVEPDHLVKFNLGLVADELTKAIRAFTDNPTAATLTALNSHWAHGWRLLKYATGRSGGGGNGAGLREPALLTEAA